MRMWTIAKLSMLGRVTAWNNISITDTLLHLAFLNAISNSILTNQYIPVKTATSSGMPDDYTYVKIGMTPEEISDIYETLYGANFLSVKLLKKQFSEEEQPYEISLQQLTRKIQNIYLLNKSKYLKIAEALGYEWNPLWNVDGEERYTALENSGANDEQTTHSYTQHTDTLTDTYGEYTDETSDSNVRTGSQTTTGARTETHDDTNSVTTFDSTDFADTDHNTGSNVTTGDTETVDYNSLTDTGSGSQTHGAHTDTHGTQYGAHIDTDSKTITHRNALNGAAEYSGGVDSFGNVVVGGDHYHTEIRERHGNIGVTKTTELIADAIDLYRTRLLQEFFDDINAEILVGVYEI